MAKATLFEQTQDASVQLEVRFKGALTKGQQVETINDLTLFNVVWNYDHKLVFVNEAESFYFLKPNFDGSLIDHWEKQTSSTVIEKYDPTKVYTLGNIVHIDQKIYQCILNTPANTLPNTTYWEVVTGEQITNRILLTNISSIVVYTNIKNPIFEAVECTFDPDVKDNDGLVKMVNPVYGEPHFERSSDIDDNNGLAYTITFEENEQPYLFTGVLNIR